MKYLNFNLEVFEYRVDGQTSRFRVRVSNSPAGEQTPGEAEQVSLPPDLHSRLRRLEKRTLNLDEMITLGEDLGGALFPPRVRQLYLLSHARLQENEGLRIRLMIDSYTLTDIPWEYVYLSDGNTPPGQKRVEGFLVFNPQISLVRYKMIGQGLRKMEALAEERMRFVAVLSNPDQTPSLDLSAEERNLKKTLEGVPQIQPEFHLNATVEALLEILIKPAHIFHFSGHGSFQGIDGTFGIEEGEGTLAFADSNGKAVDFSAEKLALNLAGRGVRFAMLGACESGKIDQINAWTGIAPALTRAGIPAVLGMQFKIRDSNAIAFSKILYECLVAGLTVDEAVSKGRLAILTLGDRDERDWGVPVLYLRAEEGVLFPNVQPGGGVLNQKERPISGVSSQPAVNLRGLREAIVRSFSLEDLQILCADIQQMLAEAGVDLQVNLDLVEGAGKTAKVQSLIGYLDRRGHLADLIKAVRDARPNIEV